MKLFQAFHEYSHNWAAVTTAHWQKYPNEKTPHVVHVEVINREVDPQTGVLRTERLIMCRQPCPAIVARILGVGDTNYVLEYSEIDPNSNVLKAVSTNLTLHDLLNVREEIVYRPNPDNLSRTLFDQSAAITAFGMISRVSSYIEDFSVKRFKDNAQTGKKAFEQVLERIVQSANGSNTLPTAQAM
ncbi:Phospholipid metabolism protein [Dimargaris xerosporica]|nr:Phospholipid metabolism protein [Dimargaris xerosporica]